MIKKNVWWLAILIAFLVYSGLVEPYWIEVTTHQLVIPGFPDEPLCIVHVADTHTTKTGRRELRLIEIVRDLRPDYVFITGDMLKGNSKVAEGLAFTSMLEAREGVFAVCGNADEGIYTARRWGTLERDAWGLNILFNESVDCGDFTLVGLGDPVTYRARPTQALAGVDPSRPVIVLTHFHPDGLLEELQEAGVDLVLSGHTHGGQLGVPLLVRLIPYTSRGRYISGLFDVNGLRLNVTRGVGTNIFPLRFLCRPQVDVFYIRGSAASIPPGTGE
jgi:predicted MPP superfamily phosphohydrolase